MTTGYQVLARKWRPQSFDDVVGQEHVIRTLRNAITRDRIAHAYLLVGPRGTGKTTLARIFAKAINCERGLTANPCGVCPSCVSISEGSNLDVLEFDAASNTQVDRIREMVLDSVGYAAASSRFKVYIIDEVHMLSGSSFNALLKTLEEPPPHVKFVFATTEVQKLPSTIISRCQRFDLRPIQDDRIVERLKLICAEEGIKADDAALAAVARLADGGMRDSQSILDQMIAFCGDSIAEEDVLEVYGLVSEADIADLARAVSGADFVAVVDLIDRFDADGRDLIRVLVDLQSAVRDALLDSVRNKGRSDLLGAPMTTEALARLLDGLRRGETTVKFGLSEKVNFEVTLLRAIESSRARAIDTLIRQITGQASDAGPDGETSPPKKKVPDGRLKPQRKPEPVPSGAYRAEPEAEEGVPGPEGGHEADQPDVSETVLDGPPVDGGIEPDLESIVSGLDASSRELLDELFRAKFVGVRKVRPDDLV